jgi:GT2 family glycosyltransferase
MIEPGAYNDVLLGFCHNGTVTAGFMNSLLAAFVEDSNRPVRRLTEYNDSIGPYIHENRARVARYFLEDTNKQWLWFVDNDMEFEPTALYTLLETAEEREIRILAAAYYNAYGRSGAYLSWLMFTPDGIKALPGDVLDELTEPLEISAAGMGCTLIHRDALQDVADMYAGDPWDTFAGDILLEFEDGGFVVGRTPEELEPAIANGRLIRRMSRMGEDVTFCLRARRAGHLTYGLPTLVVDHFKPAYLGHQPLAHGRSSAPELLLGSKED